MSQDHERIAALRKQLHEHNYAYHILNNPVITDAEYDALFKELRDLEIRYPESFDPNSPTARVGCLAPSSFERVRHKTRMLSLENTFSVEDVLKRFMGLENEPIAVEMKIDGLSLHLSYAAGRLQRAITRGDGTDGEDVTANARTISTVPLALKEPVDLEVRGEVYMRCSVFQQLNQALEKNGEDKFANPRNAASGTIRLKDPSEVARRRLSFVAYAVPTDLPENVQTHEHVLEYLEGYGFLTTFVLPLKSDAPGSPVHSITLDHAQLSEAVSAMDEFRKHLDLDTDGLVIKIQNLAKQRDLGEGNHHPNWAVAYKFAPERKVTRLLGVTVQIGKSGKLTPVAQLEPVELGGAVVQRASLCNQDELCRLGIDIGDFVFVERSAEVIPKIMGLSRPSPTKTKLERYYELPGRCPCCNTEVIKPEDMVDIFCPNHDCHDQVFARLVYATSKQALDIDGCGESTVSTLIKHDVKKLSDLFALTDFSFLKPHAAKKLKEGLEKAKAAPLWRKLCALSIEGIGKTKCQDLAAKYSDINKMVNDQPGVLVVLGGEISANAFRQTVLKSLDEIERLFDLGFEFVQDEKMMGPLSGKTFVITGTLMSGKRDDVAALIERKGGAVKGTVTRKVDYLIQGTGGGLNKAEAARKYSTKIIIEEQLYAMIGEVMPVVNTVGEEREY